MASYGRDSQGVYSQREQYQDFDVSFTRNPVTRDLIVLNSDDSIEQSVRLLVLTQYYERPYRPDIGTKLASMLFELPGSEMLMTLGQGLTSYINKKEPRVSVSNVDISDLAQFDQNAVAVTIDYLIIGKTKSYSTQILLKRIR